MGFLSDLSMVQRAGGAGVIILLLALLLMKQRQKQAQTATSGPSVAAAKKQKTPKAKSAKGMGPRKGLSLTKGRKGKAAQEKEPVAESKGVQGRMVPRLPAATADAPAFDASTAEFDATAEPALAEPVGVAADASGMISEPGWPTPGEVWAGPDRATDLAPAAPAAADVFDGDDPMAALTDVSHGDAAGWATDDLETFDPATGWDAEAGEAVPAEEAPASWEKEQAEFDWNAADSWAEPAEDRAEELASAEAAWEAPEEDETPSWSSPAEEAWQEAEEPEVEAEEPAVATAVTVKPDFPVNDWSVPAAPAEPATEPIAEVEPEVEAEAHHAEAPATVWVPVDHADEVVEDDPVTEVEETVAEPVSDVQPAFEFPVVEPIVPVADEPVEEAEPAAPIEDPAPVTVEPITIPPVEDPMPAAEVLPVEPAPAVEEAEASQEFEEVWGPLHAAVEPAVIELEPAATFDPAVVEPVAAAFEPAVLGPVVAEVPDPAARWASMAPGAVVETGASDPVSSWARLRPGQVPANGSSAPAQAAPPLAAPVKVPAAPSEVAVALAPSAAPSVAWWDVPSSVESDPRRGRFALGGYALQPGHQVVSGVTFRDGVVPPPSHWVIGPVMGAVAPGTLVLEVDGCLNCRPEDLAVLMDPGFAPTTDGFSLRLAASETGPFAMSGTYVIS